MESHGIRVLKSKGICIKVWEIPERILLREWAKATILVYPKNSIGDELPAAKDGKQMDKNR
jgi:hypothetical protein